MSLALYIYLLVLRRLLSFDIKIASVHNEKNVNADTKIHLAHVQAFFFIN